MRNRLIQLLADNRKTEGRRFEVVRAAADSDEAEILLYDAIVDSELEAEWWGGIAPEPFVRQLRGIDASTIHLRINSPGGSVFAARAMEQALREHKARIVVHVDGLAASAASFLAMAGDDVLIAKGAMFMIHKAWTLAWGNSDELQKTADLLAKLDGTLVETYVDRTGLKADQVADWMSAETWFTAAEAVEHGFADRIDEPEGEEAKASASWNLNAFLAAPRDRVQTPASRAPEAATQDHRARQAQRLRAMQVTRIE